MARKPPAPSYANVTLDPIPGESLAPSPEQPTTPRRTGKTLKEASEPHILYLHPAAAKALKRYALDQSGATKVKVHDLLLEAVQDWFRGHGLREPVRALPPRTKAGSGRE